MEDATTEPAATNGAPKTTRRYTLEEKRRLVEETFLPNETVRSVADRHGVSVNSLFVWRRELTTPAAANDAQAASASGAPPAMDNKKWRARIAVLEAETEALRSKVNDLERMLGRKTVELEMLKDAAAARRK